MISHIYDFDDDDFTCCGDACDGETYFWDAMSHVTCHACLRIAAHKFDAIAQQLRDRLVDVKFLELKAELKPVKKEERK